MKTIEEKREMVKKFEAAIKAGATAKQAASDVGVTPNRIYQIRHDLKSSKPKRKYTKRSQPAMLEMPVSTMIPDGDRMVVLIGRSADIAAALAQVRG